MIFCETTILPGERRNVQIPVPDAPPLEAVCLCGADLGRTLVVTAGVHGCEYVGIQALRRLARELDPAALTGNVILLPLANPTAFYAGAKQVVPEDGVNLNRAFPGDRKGSLSARLAFALEAALYPGCRPAGRPPRRRLQRSAPAAGILPNGGRRGGQPRFPGGCQSADSAISGPFRCEERVYSWAVQKRIPALLIERGEKGLWSEQEVDACCEDVRSLMRHLNILPGGNPPRDQTEIVEAFYAEAESEGFWYPAAGFSQQVRKGELLGHLETLSGSRLQEVRAECDGIVLYYTVALGVRAGDPLIAYGHP